MQSLFQLLIIVLSWLAVPVVLVYAYDKWVLEPKRPRTSGGRARARPAVHAHRRQAAALRAGCGRAAPSASSEVFDWAGEVAVPLSWFCAAASGCGCAIDSWFLAPRRQIAAGSTEVRIRRCCVPRTGCCPCSGRRRIIRLIRAETARFQPGAAAAVTGHRRRLVARPLGVPPAAREARGGGGQAAGRAAEPGTVDYARSFFPVALIVLMVRAFIFEPFRIPSDSMMPTLLDGDFIVVNKYAYGLRLPVLNEKFIDTGAPQRGDVVVFRYPPNPEHQLHQAPRGAAGRPRRSEGRPPHHQRRADPVAGRAARFTDGCYVGLQAVQRNHRHAHARGHVLPLAARPVRRAQLRIPATPIRCRPATARRLPRTSAAGSATNRPLKARAMRTTRSLKWCRPGIT